jgi:hypothetical protein
MRLSVVLMFLLVGDDIVTRGQNRAVSPNNYTESKVFTWSGLCPMNAKSV